jgi:hypothetical protein
MKARWSVAPARDGAVPTAERVMRQEKAGDDPAFLRQLVMDGVLTVGSPLAAGALPPLLAPMLPVPVEPALVVPAAAGGGAEDALARGATVTSRGVSVTSRGVLSRGATVASRGAVSRGLMVITRCELSRVEPVAAPVAGPLEGAGGSSVRTVVSGVR